MRRPRVTGALLAAVLAVFVLGSATRPSAASFTAALSVGSNSLTVAAVRDYFQVTPGTAVQPGTSTPVASGGVDNLALAFGTVPSARTFTNVFTVKNVTATSQTATLGLSGPSQIVSAVFAASGGPSVTLAAGASTSVSVATSPLVAGHGAGTLRLTAAGLSWLYRDYSLTIDEAPEAPATLTATAKPAARIDLSWAASTTITNLAGYDVYRAVGAGSYSKLNGSPLSGTSYSDTATTNGTTYNYKVVAVSSGSPPLTSLDSPVASATADSTPPSTPTAVALANGGGTGNAYINAANVGSVSVSVTLPAGSLASDTVTVTLTNGASSVSKTGAASAGAGTVTVSGINASSLADGTITISATSTDLAGNVSTTRTATAPKDTAAPGAPTANYTDNNNNTADVISGNAEAGASIRIMQTAPSGSGPYTGTATGGAYSIQVAAERGKPSAPIAVTYTVTATDAAGNTSSATTLNFTDTK
jgi:hypothetical protein